MAAYVKFLVRWAGSAILFALVSSPAFAQTPMSPGPTAAQTTFLGATFAQVVQGREIWLTTSNGSKQKIHVVGIVPTGLSVAGKGGQRQTIRFEEIARMEKATHRVRTHTFIGLGVGAGFGLLGAAICDGSGGCAGAAILSYAAVGAGIGALNGAIKNSLNRDDDLLYESPLRTTTMAIAPILSRTHKGVAFSMTWR